MRSSGVKPGQFSRVGNEDGAVLTVGEGVAGIGAAVGAFVGAMVGKAVGATDG
jgi:hypothetical protein